MMHSFTSMRDREFKQGVTHSHPIEDRTNDAENYYLTLDSKRWSLTITRENIKANSTASTVVTTPNIFPL